MKPLHLIMSAFGPYKEKVEIDFTKLGNNGIFLITGDTGAGKTTIFDGISFALFGESSGTHRESNTFRSKFAKKETETYVTLTFSHRDKKYKITRNPSYTVPKKRGEGETIKPSDAILEYNENIITGLKIVNEKVIEILGINANQFKQISMLAQGEFLKILFANSDERKTIFRKIFNTEIFDQITTKLYEKYKNNKDEIENLKTEFITNSNNIIFKDETIYLDKNNITKELIIKTINKLNEEVINNNKINLEIEEKLKINQKELREQEEKIKKIEENNQRIIEYNNLKEEENKLKKKEFEIKSKQDLVKNNHKILRIIKPIEINIEKLNKDLNEILIKIKEKENSIENICKTIVQIDIQEENLKKLKPTIDDYNNIKLKLNTNLELLKNVEDVLNYYNDKKSLDEEYQKEYEKYINLDKKYKEEEDKNFRNQAGIIAKKLKDKEPCPVCGSLNHPNIATTENDVLTKEELKKLKKENEEMSKKIDNIKQNITIIKSKIELFNKKINCQTEIEVIELKENLNNINIEIEETKEKLINDFNQICSRLTPIKQNIDTFILVDFIEEFHQKNDKIKEELQSNKNLLNEYQQTKINLEEKLKKENQNLIESINDLGYKTKEEYSNNILSEKEMLEIDNEIKQYETELTTNKTKIEQIKILLTNKEITDLEEEYIKLNDIISKIELIKIEMQNNYSVYSNNLKIQSKLEKTSKKLIEYMNKFTVYEDLYKLSSGTISGKRRVSFEQYVQATYFDMVLFEANIRFNNMTDGRFKLLRKETADSLNAKFALDLDVYDEYNGSRRDVKSLSGGESFKASLSLALGLSDVIQNYSGGVVIDTLFIDEGFGSLDQESREQAINTLNLISNNNKLIGIISHVSELKDRIDKKIIVSKNKEESEIKIEI